MAAKQKTTFASMRLRLRGDPLNLLNRVLIPYSRVLAEMTESLTVGLKPPTVIIPPPRAAVFPLGHCFIDFVDAAG